MNKNEISSYSNFSSIEAGIYGDILNFVSELKLREAEKKLPDIEELEKEEISPFKRDIIWEDRGKIQWEKIEKENITYYVGISQNIEIGNFAVTVENDNRENIKILFIKTHLHKEDAEFCVNDNFREWKEIIPYTGEDERKKFEGGDK